MDKQDCIVVKSAARTGYRRAGIRFSQGVNRLAELTADQLEQIKRDPYLALVAVQLDTGQETAGGAGEGGSLDPAVLGQPLTLARAIQRLDPENPDHYTVDGRPQLDALEQLVGHKVSAKQRDTAWAEFKAGQEG